MKAFKEVFMKSIVTALFCSILSAASLVNAAQTAGECPAKLGNTDGEIGGGISGVGGGGSGFVVWNYLNSIQAAEFPQMVQLMKLESGRIQGCVYDQHFGRTDVANLVTTLACTGEDTVTWPFTDHLRVKCSGPFLTDRLKFEMTYVGRQLLGTMVRVSPGDIHLTEAVMIGH